MNKKNLTISTFILKLDINIVNIMIMDVNVYHLAYNLKKIQVFVVLIKNLEFKAEKKPKLETNFKSIILKEYYNLLNIFSKKKLKYTFFVLKIWL